jgi:predicted AlkP superfamily phosphohydrolase/phosphomutase
VNNKVLLLGFDGADWKIINRLVIEGKLPAFSKLMNNGFAGPLQSTTPPISPPAWASIVTGVNPGMHGVFEFIEFDKITFEKKIRINPIRGKKVWDYLGDKGFKSIIINFPLMYPPEEINGITVSGLMTPSSAKYFTYPRQLSKKLSDEGYEVEISETELFKLLRYDKNTLYNRLIENMRKRAKISIELLNKNSWDFSMIVFGGSDRIQHFFWNKKDLLEKCYREMDSILRLFMNEVIDGQDILMVVSDHGFRKIEKYFYINLWLFQKGLLKLKKSKSNKSDIREKLLKSIHALHVDFLLNYVPESIGKKIPDAKFTIKDIDIVNTKAFCPSGYGYIYVKNMSGGKIKNLKNELLNITDPENGNKVIKQVFEKKEIYFGSYLKFSPDLIIIPNDGYFFQDKYLGDNLFDKPENTLGLAKRYGEHAETGIFLSNDPGVSANSVVDVASKILQFYR